MSIPMFYELTDDLTIYYLFITCRQKYSCECHDRGCNILYSYIMTQHGSSGTSGSKQV